MKSSKQCVRFLALLLLGVGMCVPGISGVCHAAEVADVIDAADPDTPVDFRAEVFGRRSLRRAKITREFPCDQLTFQGQVVNPCPNAGPSGEMLNVKELRYQRVTQELVPTIRLGLWTDLELRIEMPVILSDIQALRFAGNGGDKNGIAISPQNSTIAPENIPAMGGEAAVDTPDLFDVPASGEFRELPTRSGYGDTLFMLRYSPISQERDAQRANWTMEIGYRAPTGEPMQGSNQGVGRGVHELVLATAMSRAYEYADPYARFHAVIPFPAGGSLFKKYGAAQDYVGPGMRMGFLMGSEFVPYFDEETGAKFYIDAGFSGEYQAEGRDYSELFDALAQDPKNCLDSNGVPQLPASDTRGLPNVACFNPDSVSSVAGLSHDGITTVEQFLRMKLQLGMGLYVSRSVRIAAGISLAHETEHFISNAVVGEDINGDGRVDSRDPAQPNRPLQSPEHNPTYVAAIDQPGRRLRVEETTVFTAGVSLTFILDSLKLREVKRDPPPPPRAKVKNTVCSINNDCSQGEKCCSGLCQSSSSSCKADEGDVRSDGA